MYVRTYVYNNLFHVTNDSEKYSLDIAQTNVFVSFKEAFMKTRLF